MAYYIDSRSGVYGIDFFFNLGVNLLPKKKVRAYPMLCEFGRLVCSLNLWPFYSVECWLWIAAA